MTPYSKEDKVRGRRKLKDSMVSVLVLICVFKAWLRAGLGSADIKRNLYTTVRPYFPPQGWHGQGKAHRNESLIVPKP